MKDKVATEKGRPAGENPSIDSGMVPRIPLPDTRTEKETSWLKPSVILPIVMLLMAAMVLFGPKSQSSDKRLTSYSTNESGVQGIYDVLQQLGYPVERRVRSMSEAVSPDAIYVLLSTPVSLSDTELNQLLNAVRNGAGLIFAWEPRLTDSLGFSLKSSFGLTATLLQTRVAGGEAPVPSVKRPFIPLPLSATVSRQDTWKQDYSDTLPQSAVFLWSVPLDTRDRWAGRDSTQYPAIILGTPIGKGHAVIVSDPEILRNTFAKDGRPIFAFIRAIEWINANRVKPLPVVFDEYHQGFGLHANVPDAIRDALLETPAGRTAIQLAIAALALLFALGTRAIAPTARTVIARRSLIEHVGALAHAYEQTHAKQLAADRLIRGLRRRHPLGTPRNQPHEMYLDRLAAYLPATRTDVETLRAFLQDRSADPIEAAGISVARIEALSKLR